MKPSPQSQRFIYENQTPSAISDQKQQPSGQGYQGRTGKAINCQSLHRSTSQSTTAPPPPNPLTPTPACPYPKTHTHMVHQLFTVKGTHARAYFCSNLELFAHYMMGTFGPVCLFSALDRIIFLMISSLDCRINILFSLDKGSLTISFFLYQIGKSNVLREGQRRCCSKDFSFWP